MKLEHRAVTADRGTLTKLWGLLGLALLEGTAGLLTGSKALLADACYSATGSAGSFLAHLGWKNARKPRSIAQQSEIAAAILLSAVLLVAGFECGLASVRSLADGPEEAPGWGAVAAIAAGWVLREGIMRYKRRCDSRIGLRGERSVRRRTDAAVSLVALTGASGAMAGQLLEMPVLYALDPVAGVVVSAWVLRSSCRLTLGVLRQSAPDALCEAEEPMLLEAVQHVEGVVAVDEIRAREQGHYIVVDAIIRVNPRISVTEGHDIAQRVRRQLTRRFLHIADASIQVRPYDPGYPYKSNHEDEEWSTLVQ